MIIGDVTEEIEVDLSVFADAQPLTIEEAKLIQDVGEMIFALAVITVPHLSVYYHPRKFRTEKGKKTTPDFFVFNRHNPRTGGVYVEVTEGLNLEDSYSKSKQRRVMQAVDLNSEGTRYLQLNGAVLANLQTSLWRKGWIKELHQPLNKKAGIEKIQTEKIGSRQKK